MGKLIDKMDLMGSENNNEEAEALEMKYTFNPTR